MEFKWENITIYAKIKKTKKKIFLREISNKDIINNIENESNYKKSDKCMKTKILCNVSGSIKTGETLAIIGTSGAGKTTLLNFLSKKINTKNLLNYGKMSLNDIEIKTFVNKKDDEKNNTKIIKNNIENNNFQMKEKKICKNNLVNKNIDLKMNHKNINNLIGKNFDIIKSNSYIEKRLNIKLDNHEDIEEYVNMTNIDINNCRSINNNYNIFCENDSSFQYLKKNLINKENLYCISEQDFEAISSYVMQDDILDTSLTPLEILLFTAKLKLDLPKIEIEKKVNQMLKDLNLLDCKNTKIGNNFIRGVSGGERKRTSIAKELISDPIIIFLDEPTTGLDSFNAYNIINNLFYLAKKHNKIIIFTIHQPSSEIYQILDKLCILADGKNVFYGYKENAINFFNDNLKLSFPINYNPFEFFLEMTNFEVINNKKVKKIKPYYDLLGKSNLDISDDEKQINYKKYISLLNDIYEGTKILIFNEDEDILHINTSNNKLNKINEYKFKQVNINKQIKNNDKNEKQDKNEKENDISSKNIQYIKEIKNSNMNYMKNNILEYKEKSYKNEISKNNEIDYNLFTIESRSNITNTNYNEESYIENYYVQEVFTSNQKYSYPKSYKNILKTGYENTKSFEMNEKKYNETINKLNNIIKLKKFSKGFCFEFCMLFYRSTTISLRNKKILFFKLLENLFMGALLSILYQNVK